MAGKITVSAYLLGRLKQCGVEHVFAVPGDFIGDFLDVLDQTDGVSRVGAVNELEAGFAADGYARARGLSCVALQYGVGTYSALNAVAGACRERVPMVVMTGAPGLAVREKWLSYGIVIHHSTDAVMDTDQKVFANFTVATEVVRTAEEAPAAIDRAIAAAIAHSAPAYLQIWRDVQTAMVEPPSGQLVIAPPSPSWRDSLEAALDKTMSRLCVAKNPVLWGGLELQRYRLGDQLSRLITVSGAPFTTTIQSKGVLADTDPHCIGTFAGAASDPVVSTLMQKADLVISLGVVPIDYYQGFVIDKFDQTIAVEDSRVRIGQARYEGVGFRDFLAGLIERIEAASGFPRETGPSPRRLAPVRSETEKITYENLFDRIQAVLGPDTAVFCDLGVSMFMGVRLEIQRRNGFTAQADWASLGYAVPGALGFALSEGDPVVAITGDGSFQMTAQALSTYSRTDCDVTIIVIDNGIYALEQCFTGLDAYRKRPDGHGYEGDFDSYNVLKRWDYAAMARSLGLEAWHVDTLHGLDIAFGKAAQTKAAKLIHVEIGERDLPPEMFRLVKSFKKKG